MKVSKQAICDPNHYTIYERYQNIEHPLGGDENIYEIWLNWAANRDQVQFKLKLNKAFCEPIEKNDDRHKLKNKVINKIIKIIFFNKKKLFEIENSQ